VAAAISAKNKISLLLVEILSFKLTVKQVSANNINIKKPKHKITTPITLSQLRLSTLLISKLIRELKIKVRARPSNMVDKPIKNKTINAAIA